MTEKDLQRLRKIQNGDNTAYIELLLLNDKEQLLTQIKKANPDFYKVNEPAFLFDETPDLARKISQAWESKKIIMPKFKFVPANNSYVETFQRIKLMNK